MGEEVLEALVGYFRARRDKELEIGEAMQVPEAAKAAPALLAGFADMFLPSILASSIESEFTRFVIAALSVTQLIYMSEVGAVILKSKVPLNIFELGAIFLIRTVVTFPIIVAIAHLFVF